jgi:hypothetical protein
MDKNKKLSDFMKEIEQGIRDCKGLTGKDGVNPFTCSHCTTDP